MLFRQLFDYETYTYTYLLADETRREAVLIDPVQDQLGAYLQLLRELDLKLVLALDTHVHADHITALGDLRAATGARTLLGKPGDVSCADDALHDGARLTFGRHTLEVIYTPGHTDDSYCFYLREQGWLFSGDTLFIRGSGRTDFQNGSAAALYDSLWQRVLTLPDETLLYPGHDYKGWSVSTLGEEKAHNPRLQLKEKAEFIDFMHNLKLPNPKFMDVAVPANRQCGKGQHNAD